MATHRLNEFEKLLNLLEEQTHYFGMINALIEVAISETFFNHGFLTLHYYLRAICEIIDKSSLINEASLSLLRKQV